MSYSHMSSLMTVQMAPSTRHQSIYSSTFASSIVQPSSPWKVGEQYGRILDKIRLSPLGMSYDDILAQLTEHDYFKLHSVLGYFCEMVGSKYRLVALHDGSRYLSADGSHVLERGTLRF